MTGFSKELPPNQQHVIDALEKIGKMGSIELSHYLGRHPRGVLDSLRRLKRRGLVRIAGWERQPIGQKGRCKPLYGLGSEPDEPALKALPRTEYNKRWYDKHKARISIVRYGPGYGIWQGLVK